MFEAGPDAHDCDAGERSPDVIRVAATELLADPSGALYWPDEGALIVADLHLEKGSAFAKRGMLLPPYSATAPSRRCSGAALRRTCWVRRHCFAADGHRMVMPAFGAYAGGLNIRDRAFAALFGRGLTAHLLGEQRLYAFSAAHCLAD